MGLTPRAAHLKGAAGKVDKVAADGQQYKGAVEVEDRRCATGHGQAFLHGGKEKKEPVDGEADMKRSIKMKVCVCVSW